MPNEERIGTAVLELTTDASSLRKGLTEGKQDAEGWAKGVGEKVRGILGGVLSVAGGMIAAQGLRLLTSGISDMVREAVALEPLQRTFDNLIESVGGEGVDAMEAMRVATRGMVDEAALLSAGSQLLAMGIADSTEGLADQIEVATQLGAAMGKTAAESIENWALLNANMSFQRLDLFGISAGKVRKRVNELMEATAGLSREQAFSIATMEEAQIAMARVGEQGDDTAGDMARLQALWADLSSTVGEALIPVLSTLVPLAQAAGERLKQTFASPQFLNSLDNFIEFVQDAIKFLSELDPVAVKSGAAVAAFGLALPSIVIGVQGVTAALAALQVVMLANPLVLLAAAIVAAGLAIVAAADAINDKAAEVRQEQHALSQSLALSSASYAEYTERMIEAIREQRNIGTEMTDAQIAMVALREGIFVSEQNWASYVSLLRKDVGPALRDTMDDIQSVGQRLRDAAAVAQWVVDNVASAAESVRFSSLIDEYRNLYAALEATPLFDIAKSLAEAFDSEQIGDAIRDMGVRAAQIMEDIQADFAEIAQQGADQRREILFSHNLDQLEAQARFDNEFAALTAAGRTEDANDLAASFDNQRALTDRQLAIRLQLQERSILLQKITQAKAYVAELTEQGDQIRRVFANELKASEAFQKLGVDTQADILKAIYEGGSAALLLEAELGLAMLAISADVAEGRIQNEIDARLAIEAAWGGNIGAAQDYRDQLQREFDDWEIELPPLPAFNLGDVGGDGAGTDRQIAETVTKPLSQAVNEIARAITAAKGAIEDLIGFELGEGVEQGFDELGRFVALGITKFQGWFEDDPGLEPALDAIKDLFGPVGELLQLLSIDVSKLATFAGDFLPEAERFVSQIRDFTAVVQPWLADVATFWGVEEVELWAEAARNLKDFFAIMPDLAKIDPVEGPHFTRDAIRYISQLREFGGIIQPWLAAVVEFWTVERVEEWGKAATHLKNFFAIFPDLSKIQPVEGETFSDDALRYVWQVREFVMFVKPWLEDIVRWWTPELVAQWGEAAANVAKFFTLMPDLSLVAPVEAETFTADASRYVWQIREFVKNVKPWLEDVAKFWTPAKVEEWADVAQNLAKFFDLMPDFSVVTPFPGDFTTAFRAFVANIDIAATELMRELERVRTGPLGDVLEELAATSEQLQSVLGLLSLASMFEDLQRVEKLKKGERRTALSNVVVVFIEQLKRASEQLKDAIPEIEAIWDGMLDRAVIFADKIAAFFTAIRDAIVAGAQIATETDFDVDAIMRQIRLLAALGTQVAAVQFPSMAMQKSLLLADPGGAAGLSSFMRDKTLEGDEISGHAVIDIRLRSKDLRAEVSNNIRGLRVRLIDQAAADTAQRR